MAGWIDIAKLAATRTTDHDVSEPQQRPRQDDHNQQEGDALLRKHPRDESASIAVRIARDYQHEKQEDDPQSDDTLHPAHMHPGLLMRDNVVTLSEKTNV